MDIQRNRRLLRFGVFQVDSATGELHKQGRRIRLATQPAEILLLLLERPGDVVAREEIQRRLWPDGTFVDFDHSLNTAVAKLRDALADSAVNPKFVETVAKRGYRFVAPVISESFGVDGDPPSGAASVGSICEAAASQPAAAISADPDPAGYGPLQRFLTRPEDVPQNAAPVARVLFLLAQIMYLSFYIAVLAYSGEVTERLFEMTTLPLPEVLVILATTIGVPVRLYLISGLVFRARGMRRRFLNVLFPVILALDLLWAASPFLLADRISWGLSLAATAALAYLPFAQRTLVLMGALGPESADQVAKRP
jgi:DNA-binding winged helix-turn-helix (wHTH) protein